MRQLAGLDWAIVGGYLLLSLVVGLVVSRRAGESLESYFVAGRGLPWWWLGTSMVATTFAADTPLVVTGLVARHGVAGNWLWWSWAITYVSMAVIFAALWRRARIITDAELVELRYQGPSATVLRAFKALFFSVVINGIVLGWVIRAMAKIAQPFVPWEAWLGPGRFATLAGAWPSWLLFGTLNDTLTVLALLGLISLYSSMGGIRGVIFTDLVQFALALIASVGFAWIAVDAVGGIEGLRAGLERHHDAEEVLAFIPPAGSAWLPLQVVLVYLSVQWWAQYFADGSGYYAQRLFTAKSDQHAEGGALWFVIANFGLRTWPWVLLGLVSLVVFPLGAESLGGAGAELVAADREMGYPVLMARLLPTGLLGLMFASLLAAFMSTVDTHLNWGTSYLVNDIYLRFLRPGASQRELVRVSRLTVLGLTVLAVLIASQISSIEQAWKFFIALGAGLGLPGMLRWLWWRANAWTEIVGMSVAALAAFTLYPLLPAVREEYLIAAIALLSAASALLATFVTAPVPREHLERFVRRVRPPGWWREMGGATAHRAMGWLAAGWLFGNLGVFGITFSIGHLLFGRMLLGSAALAGGAGAIGLTLVSTRRARALLGPAEPRAEAG